MGRPRLCLQRDRRCAASASDRTADQQATPPRRANPGRHPDPRGLARQETTAQNLRSARTPPLPVERTNAWLKAKRRIATRRDRKADTYLTFLHLGMILILARSF